MNIWLTLGIEQTKDKDAIKRAYRQKLQTVNPEEDADGFMELRNAYEEAVAYCDGKEAQSGDMEEAAEGMRPPHTELTEKLERLYKDYPNRIRLAAWEELLTEDAFQSLDTEQEAVEELLVFLMEHYNFPCAIWRAIVEQFDLRERKADWMEIFQEDYISYILGCAEKKTDAFEYSYLTGDYTYADDYISLYQQVDRNVSDPQQRESVKRNIAKLKSMPLTHPYTAVLEIYLKMRETKEQEHAEKHALSETEAADVYGQLLAEMEPIAAAYPDDPLILFGTCELLYRQKRYTEAKALIDEILRIDPDYYDAHFCLGDIYYAMGDLEKAKETFEDLVHNNYGDMGALSRLQSVNTAMIEKLKKDVEDHPDEHQKKLDLAWCYYQNQREADALEVFDTFEPEGDEIFTYCNAKGRCYLATGQSEKALPLFFAWKKAVEELQPEDGVYTEEQQKKRKRYPYIHTLIADCYVEQKEYEKAKTWIAYSVETEHEERIAALTINLRILYALREYGNCLKACDAMLADTRYADEYWAHCYRAKCCYMLDYLQECIYSAEKAIRIYPYGVEPYIQEILTFQQAEQYEDAEHVMAQYRELMPEGTSDAMDYYEAVSLRKQGHVEEATKLLEKLESGYNAQETDLQEEYTDMLFELADLYDEADRNEESIELYKKVAEIKPKDPDVYGYLGYMYRKIHARDLAIKAYEEQIRIRPHSAFYTNLGYIYWDMREYEKSLENYRHALAISPEESEREIRRKTEVIRFLSRDLLCMNQLSEGCQVLLDAMQTYDDEVDPQLRIEAGLGLTRANRYTEAKALLQSYAEDGTDTEQRFACASLLMELAGEEEDIVTMDQMYQLGMELKPDNTSIYGKYGRVLVMNGRYDDAVKAYKKAVNCNKTVNYYSELLQALYLRDGEIKSEYADYLSKAVIPEEDRDTPLAYIKLARYCRVIGDFDDAKRYLEQAITINLCESCGYNGCEEGYYELGILYEVMGELKKAVSAYEKSLKAHGHCLAYERRLQKLQAKIGNENV